MMATEEVVSLAQLLNDEGATNDLGKAWGIYQITVSAFIALHFPNSSRLHLASSPMQNLCTEIYFLDPCLSHLKEIGNWSGVSVEFIT